MFTGYEKCVILVEFLSSLGRPGKAMGRMRQVLSCIRAQLPIPPVARSLGVGQAISGAGAQ